MKSFIACSLSPSIIRMIKSRRMRWACSMNEGQERDHWDDQDAGGYTILKWILERQDGMVWIRLSWLRIKD
jgi:hypothetical protein